MPPRRARCCRSRPPMRLDRRRSGIDVEVGLHILPSAGPARQRPAVDRRRLPGPARDRRLHVRQPDRPHRGRCRRTIGGRHVRCRTEHQAAAAVVDRPGRDDRGGQRDRLPARRDDPPPRRGVPDRRSDRHLGRGAGRGFRARHENHRLVDRLRRLVGLRRPRSGPARDPPPRRTIRPDGDADRPPGTARRRGWSADGRGGTPAGTGGGPARSCCDRPPPDRRIARPLGGYRGDPRVAGLRARHPLAASSSCSRAG